MQGLVFKGMDDGHFYYSPTTNRIIKIPSGIKQEEIIEEEGKFVFWYDQSKILRKLSCGLDTLILEGSQDCNMRCSYCIYGGIYLGERRHLNFNMGCDVAKKATEFFLAHSKQTRPFRFISFYGGEPMLNTNLIEQVVEENGGAPRLRFSISTNGTMLAKKAEFLRKNNILVSVSLDGPKEIHDKYRKNRNGKGTFDVIMEQIEKLDPHFVRNNLSFSSTLQNPLDIRMVYAFFLERFPYSAIRIGFVKSWDLKEGYQKITATQEDFIFLGKEYEKYIRIGRVPSFLKFFFDLSMERIYNRGGRLVGREITPRGFCVPGTRKLFVKPDGRFYTCEKLGYGQFEIGDVEKGIEVSKVLNLVDIINRYSQEECSNCWATPLCNSCILLDSVKEGRINTERTKENCRIKRQSIINYLKLYIELHEALGTSFVEYLKKLKGGDENDDDRN